MASPVLAALSHASPFATAVRSRSWDWLFELRRRLNVEVQLVDEHANSSLPQPPGHVAAAVARLLSSDHPDFLDAVGHAMRSRAPAAIALEPFHVVCFGLSPGRDLRGVLVLARDVRGLQAPIEEVRRELELIGSWLSTAIDAHLTSESIAEREDLNQISSLCRVLTDAAGRGSDRAIVAAFVEALAVWTDLEVFGYAANVAGEYALEVSMPGADRTRVPAKMEAAAVPVDAELIHLSRNDGERLEVDMSQDVVLMPIAEQGGTPRWLIVLSGAPDRWNDVRLALYARLLDHWVAERLALSASRISVGLVLQLLPTHEHLETTVSNALDELTSSLDASATALVITLSNGMEWLRVGDQNLLARWPGEADLGSGGLSIVKRTAPCSIALAVRRADRRPFTRAAETLAQSAADIFQLWASDILGRPGQPSDRRTTRQPFAEMLDRLAARATAEGASVTAAVLSAADGRFRPTSVIQAWIGALRSNLRPRDLAGAIREGEIGLLLADTGASQAELVITRIRELIAVQGTGEPLALTVGVATREPGGVPTGSLIEAARAHAAEQRSAPSWDLDGSR